MAHQANASEIKKVRVYVRAVEKQLNAMQIVPRSMRRYPFDALALAIVSKAFALSKACLKLLDSGFPDEAFGLVRSLVECAINLRFMTQDLAFKDKRARDFVKYAEVTKRYWLYYALQQFAGKPEEENIRDYADKFGLDPDPKSARRHWSGLNGFIWEVAVKEHPLDGPAVTEQLKKLLYAADYHSTSTAVHCSLLAIDNYFVEDQAVYEVLPANGEYHHPSQSTLFLILIYLHSTIAYALYGLNIDRPSTLSLEFENVVAKMKPVERLHR